ncbi:hypothetical protein GQ54DRAFT_330105 [Martensiomyces pterosporus]|nr:hypothetical protein GQ54DRAFT_330105 [Martensiomyces pterosporus]
MDSHEPDNELCTCSAVSNHSNEHTPPCLLYTPISAMDIPATASSHRGTDSNSESGSAFGRLSSNARPPSYSTGYGIGILTSSQHPYPTASSVSSVAASYASTSSIFDSAAATETESLSSYPYKRPVSVCSFSSTASSFHLLPTELFRAVFMYLSVEDLKSVVLISRQWRSAANPLLWRSMYFPLDKRRLAQMKYTLSHFGHHVRKVIIAPPVLESQQPGGVSRQVSVSNQRGWSFSRPLSRSGSTSSSQQQQAQQQGHGGAANSGLESAAAEGSNLATPILNPAAGGMAELDSPSVLSNAFGTPTALPHGSVHGGFINGASSPQRSSLSHQFPPPPPLSASSSRQRAPSTAMSTPALPESSASGRRLSRSSMATSPSPLLPPTYAVPIPGTPGPGNVISEILPPSMVLGSSGSAAGSASHTASASRAANMLGHHPGSAHSHHHHYHEVSEGTVLRMHQFMERFCPNILEAVIKNPTGIASHARRVGILSRLFHAYPRLEKLDLSDFIMWDTQPLQVVSEQLQFLTSLDVTNRVELSDTDLLPVVENCPRLREIRIRATNATDATIHAIINHLSHSLVSLNVGGCPVSSAAMAELVVRCTRLRILQTWSCLRLDDNFLLALDPGILTDLQVLDMMDVQKFSIEVVRRTFGMKRWPYLKYLRIKAKCVREDFAGIPERAVLKLNSTTILD